MDWKKYLNSRLLLRTPFSYTSLFEAVVEEVSPSGRVKLRWTNGTAIWYNSDEYVIVEELSNPVEELNGNLKKILRVE